MLLYVAVFIYVAVLTCCIYVLVTFNRVCIDNFCTLTVYEKSIQM